MEAVTEEPAIHATMLDGLRAVLPFAASDLVDGAAFGVIAAGLGIAGSKAIALSATAFSGSAQFAALTVLGDHGSVFALLAAVIALNARYLVFSASVAESLSANRLRRAGEAQLLTDAAWAIAFRPGRPSRELLVAAGGAELVAWTAGTAIGALAGGAVGGYRTVGLDAVLPAFFVCLLVERVVRSGGAAGAVAGGVGAVVLTPFLPAGLPLLAVLGGALLLARGRT
jgi:predicted branched-subunit amino acid permease